ncbi:MAG TPA: orotidine-5'-phosphate decarboxylase [Steroidobacteraceae bacterium]|nr:orotidine-5'-phosphate decarboxylase [Steroidobacteraceae bacterium]
MPSLPPRERLIFALDVPDAAAARRMVERLGDSVLFYKLGLELLMAGGYHELLDWVAARGKKVFADLKFYDIPATVAGAVRGLNGRGVSFATVHGNAGIVEAAVGAARDIGILAVTVLTSFDRADVDELGLGVGVEPLVLARARRARAAGAVGVIASGVEAPAIRRELGTGLAIVTPGIRPAENRPADDQKRVLTVERAFAAGADYIVVGRPIRDAADPRAAAEAIQASILATVGGR